MQAERSALRRLKKLKESISGFMDAYAFKLKVVVAPVSCGN
jgi:hypothetical protein